MKVIPVLAIAILFTYVSCSDNITNPPGGNSNIAWDKISGNIAYLYNDSLFLANKMTMSVKNLGSCSLNNLKFSHAFNLITGVILVNIDDVLKYTLEAYDLDGNHSEVDEPETFGSNFYDWLPDGRLAHINQSGYVFINNFVPTIVTFNANGMACSPDGKKIVVANFDEADSIAELIEIDIATGDSSVLSMDRYNHYSDPVYSPDSKKVLFVNNRTNNLGNSVKDIFITPHTSLGITGENPDWSPDGSKVIFSYIDIDGTHIFVFDINENTSTEVIPGGKNPLWIE